MVNQLLEQILDQCYTKHQALTLLSQLKESLTNQIFNHPSTTSYPAWVKQFTSYHLTEFNHNNLYEIFDEVEKKIKSLEPLILYLPLSLPEEEIVKLYLFIRNNLQPILLEIKVDPSLIGGAALAWRGIYQDYSLKVRISQQRDMIKRYLEQSKGK